MLKSAIKIIASTATVLLAGCYSPGGGLFSHSGGPQTYTSNEVMQKSIKMIDVRNGETFFAMDIPPGKQLTFDFEEGEGDDPVNRPDLLRWELLDNGTRCGTLHNALSVPNGPSRRIDVYLNHGVKYATVNSVERSLRTDEVNDRPDWWTPEGGPMPKDKRTQLYDN
jgi:hypothetical protein